jgi:hypothetical protein
VVLTVDSAATDSIPDLQILGAGPAGIGMILALCNRIAAGNETVEQKILDGLQIFEADSSPGGKMELYQLNANTNAPDVVLGIQEGNPFFDIREHYLRQPETQSRLIPLPRIGELLVQPLVQRLTQFLGRRLQCNVKVARIEISDQGLTSFDEQDQPLALTKNVLFCCGGEDQPLPMLRAYADRWEGSDHFLLRNSVQKLPQDNGPVVIIGASHSAFSCAWRLLYDPLFEHFAKDRDIVILQRRGQIKLRCDTAFAQQHQVEYDQSDVCPKTGIVFFNGGLRKDAKMLFLKIRDGEEKRARILKMETLEDQKGLLQRAALIIQATGFAPNLPRIERDSKILEITEPTSTGQLCDRANGQVIGGLFGMGLGMNIVSQDDGPGEASFYGGIHGFQSYPLSTAPHIIDHLVTQSNLETVT